MASVQTSPSLEQASEKLSREEKFSRAWAATFGIRQAQVFFPDGELNARVYTLDGESGYKVQEKKVKLGPPLQQQPVEVPEDSQRLAYPKKARRGENHGRARLEKPDILAIRAWADELKNKGIVPPWTAKAAELNVSEGTLRDIVARRTWGHI